MWPALVAIESFKTILIRNIMKKISTLLLFAGLFGAQAIVAAPLTPEEALSRVSEVGLKKVSSKAKAGTKLVYTSKTENGLNGAYLYNLASGGYIVLSADDIAYPLLGYSDQGSINLSEMSPELKWWLEEYSRQIEWAVSRNLSPAKTVGYDESWTAIAPLVTTRWNQDAPYNDQCPQLKANGPRCYAGCVAVSMAQVMKYHNYPEVGEGLLSNTDKGRPSLLNLSTHPIDWDNMLNVYSKGDYTQEQGDAVAFLMKACGYSVNMNYGTSASGTSGMNIGPALRDNFNYDQNCRGEYRCPYSTNEWAAKVYDNLKNVGPLVINGQSPFDGGHSFVCDGYDGNGYFHINWGWGGYSDGYFLLDALNPDAQGIGGASGGFNFSQNAIFGIQPPTGAPKEVVYGNIIQWGSLVGTLTGKNLVFSVKDYKPLGFASSLDSSIKVNIGAIIEPVDGTSGEKKIVAGTSGRGETVEITNGSYFQNTLRPSVTLPSLGNGEYKVYFATKDLNYDDAPWQPVIAPYGIANYVMLTVADGVYTIKDVERDKYTISKAEITTGVYQNANFMIKATVTNSSNIQLNEGIAPVLYKGTQRCFVGESTLASIDPGVTTDIEWVSKFYALSGVSVPTTATTYTLRLYDPKTETDYGTYGEVELLPAPGEATISLRGASFPGMESESVEYEGKYYPTVFLLDDKENVHFNFKYRVTKGYFDGQLLVNVVKIEGKVPVPMIDQIYSDMPFLMASNQNQEVDIKFNFSQGEENEIYGLQVQYVSSGIIRTLGTFYYTFGLSGVKNVEVDAADVVPEYYNLQGIRINEPRKGDIVVKRMGGKSELIKF